LWTDESGRNKKSPETHRRTSGTDEKQKGKGALEGQWERPGKRERKWTQKSKKGGSEIQGAN